MFMCTKFSTYNTTIDQDISQSLVFYFIVDTVYMSGPKSGLVKSIDKTEITSIVIGHLFQEFSTPPFRQTTPL